MDDRVREWSPGSWRSRRIHQHVDYDDPTALAAVEAELRTLPPIVLPSEIRALEDALAHVALGDSLLLQAGDCAESFDELGVDTVAATLRTLLEMAAVLTFAGSRLVLKIGRIAGQYAKPRSATTELVDGVEMLSYRGDIINGASPRSTDRRPDPHRMLRAYARSAATANLLAGMLQSKPASVDLHERHESVIRFLSSLPSTPHVEFLSQELRRALAFLSNSGVFASLVDRAGTAVYLSHEALLLPYEEGLTRWDDETGQWYDGSAHMVWIGERTRGLEDAHVEYVSGLGNPIGVKCGSSLGADELLRLIDRLNPENRPGRLTLIVRMGADKLERNLAQLIRAVNREGRVVVWISDPMHGNTIRAPNGLKTRDFDDISKEALDFFSIHKSEGTHAGGLHIEMTGAHVTECTGGAQGIRHEQLSECYRSLCDPRLNYMQSLELATLLARELATGTIKVPLSAASRRTRHEVEARAIETPPSAGASDHTEGAARGV